jgi:hypothetical protein
MSTLGSVYIKHPKFDVEASLRVSYDSNPAKHNGDFVQTATLSIETGACAIQVYATADTMRELAALLTEAADKVDAGVAAAQPVAEAA